MPKLTKTLVDSLPAPSSGDAWTWDSELEGFGVRVQASGRKTYVVRYRTKDAKRTQRKMTICRCTDMPPDKAREQARKVFAQVAEGSDPAAERKPAGKSTAATVEALFKGYVGKLEAKGQPSAVEVKRMLLTGKDNAADALGRDRPAAEVTPADVIKFVSGFFKRGKRGAADKARSYIASSYAWGIASANDYTVENPLDWGIAQNPAAAVAKDSSAVSSRTRNLDASEIRQLWTATLEGNGGMTLEVGACIRLLIACGQRVQETLRIDGSEVDLEAAIWTMPKEKTKGRKHAHKIPLPAAIIPTLQELKAKHGDGPLFPARCGANGDRIAHFSIGQAIRRWLDEDGVDVAAFQPRDLRRTWKSRTADAGIDRFTRDLIQQHARGDTGSKHYDMADYLPQMRAAMAKWSAWLGIVLSGGTPPAYGEPLVKAVA